MNSGIPIDIELLREFVATRSDEAFAQLMRRNMDLVFGAAMRQTGNPALAEEVTQIVFITLFQKAPRLRPGTSVAGWLIRAARFASLHLMRSEARRKEREMEESPMYDPNDPPEWTQLAPRLDECMVDLREDDREILLLRYFKQMPIRDVASAMQIGEAAAKKRIERALGRLRGVLHQKGVALPAITISALLASQKLHATAPPGLVTRVLASAADPSPLTQKIAAQAVTGSAALTPLVVKWALPGLLAATIPFVALEFTTPAGNLEGLLQRELGALEKEVASQDRQLQMARGAVRQESKARMAEAEKKKAAGALDFFSSLMQPDLLTRERLEEEINNRYAKVWKKLNFTPEERKTVRELLIARRLREQDRNLAAFRKERSEEEVERINAEDKAEMDRQLGEILGEARRDYMVWYREAEGDFQKTEELQAILERKGFPMTDSQQEQLVAIFHSETAELEPWGMVVPTDKGTQASILIPKEKMLAAKKDSLRRVLESARPLLDERQHGELASYLDKQLTQTEVEIDSFSEVFQTIGINGVSE